MIVFSLENVDNLEIIPVQLNIMFNNILVCREEKKIISPVPGLFTEDWGKLIKKYILRNTDMIYVIDMNGIQGAEKAFEHLAEIENIILIYVNCQFLIPSYLRGTYKENIELMGNDIFANMNGKAYIDEVFKDCNQFYQRLSTYYKDTCARKLDKEGISKEITLNRSSNVYATAYVDIRKLLSYNNNISIFLYALYRIVLQMDSFDSFVVVSNNGAILANILAEIFGKPVLYLLNLGPKIAIKDNEIRSEIKKGSKYIYIYDFLCLGNEYKLLDMLLKINGAKLVNGIGIAQLLPSDRYGTGKENPKSIVCLKEYPEIFSYKIACYKEELKKEGT